MASTAVDVFTPDYAKAAVSDETMRDAMLAKFAGKVKTRKRGEESFALAAAYTTFAYFEANPDATPGSFAKATGADRASVYGWRRKGVLLVSLGWDPKSPEYAALNVAGNPINRAPLAGVLDGLGRDGMGSGATVNEKGETVQGDRIPVTEEDIRWAESLLFTEPDEKGKRKVRTKDEVAVAVAEDLGIDLPGETAEQVEKARQRNIVHAAALLARELGKADEETRAAVSGDLAKIGDTLEAWKRKAEAAAKRAEKAAAKAS